MDSDAGRAAAPAPALDDHDLDQEIQDMKRHALEMEAQLQHFHANVQARRPPTQHQPPAVPTAAIDDNSIYIGQVDYSTTAEDLVGLFHGCGPIARVTIVCDKATGQPKGYAYIEFAIQEAVHSALLLNNTPFRGRQLKVTTKRVNERGFNVAGRGRGGHSGRAELAGGRGRGSGGRGGGRSGRSTGRGEREGNRSGEPSPGSSGEGSGQRGDLPPLGPGGRVVYL